MCERTCPGCKSTDHFIGYGLAGTTIWCNGCGLALANRRDREAAPTDMITEEQVDTWWAAGSGVLVGAEAKDPEDDKMFGSNRWPLVVEENDLND